MFVLQSEQHKQKAISRILQDGVNQSRVIKDVKYFGKLEKNFINFNV